MKNRPFALIGVNSDDLPRALNAVASNKLNWRSFQNRPAGAARAISDEWSIEGWPTIVVLDGQRRIHYRGHDAERATVVAEHLVGEVEAAQKPR